MSPQRRRSQSSTILIFIIPDKLLPEQEHTKLESSSSKTKLYFSLHMSLRLPQKPWVSSSRHSRRHRFEGLASRYPLLPDQWPGLFPAGSTVVGPPGLSHSGVRSRTVRSIRDRICTSTSRAAHPCCVERGEYMASQTTVGYSGNRRKESGCTGTGSEKAKQEQMEKEG